MAYRKERNRRVAACMSLAGHPQPETALEYDEKSVARPRIQSRELYEPLVEFWPTSDVHVADGYPPDMTDEAILRSNNAEFEAALDGCEAEQGTSGADASAVELSSLIEEGRQIMVTTFDESDYLQTVDRWLQCLDRNGYEVVDDGALWEGDFSQAFGLEFGDLVADEPIVDPPELRAGEVRIDVPPAGLSYAPTEEERLLAQSDLDCKIEVGFVSAIEVIHGEARAKIEQRFGSRISELKESIESR